MTKSFSDPRDPEVTVGDDKQDAKNPRKWNECPLKGPFQNNGSFSNHEFLVFGGVNTDALLPDDVSFARQIYFKTNESKNNRTSIIRRLSSGWLSLHVSEVATTKLRWNQMSFFKNKTCPTWVWKTRDGCFFQCFFGKHVSTWEAKHMTTRRVTLMISNVQLSKAMAITPDFVQVLTDQLASWNDWFWRVAKLSYPRRSWWTPCVWCIFTYRLASLIPEERYSADVLPYRLPVSATLQSRTKIAIPLAFVG